MLRHGLGRKFGVDVGGSQEEKLLNSMAVRRVDDVGLNLKIDGNEISRVSVVGMDSTAFGRRDDNKSRLLQSEERIDVVLAYEIELGVGSEN